jgi:hypothetical protein
MPGGTPVLDGFGGPDAFGYRWIDSDEPGGPIYSWVDISGVGTAITTGQWIPSGGTSGSDDGYYPVLLPFGFTYYGLTYDTVFISTNGNLRFVRPAAVDYTNAGIPVNDQVNNVLAAFWDDLNLTSGGSVHYYHDATNSRFVVQYTNVPPYSGTGTFSFEMILKPDGRILSQYLSLSGTVTSATVGIENSAGTDGLQIVFNSTYLHNGLAIEFRNGNWIAVSPASGTIPPSNSQNVNVKLHATEAPGTLQHGNILIYSNDPGANPKTVPVGVSVTAAPQTINIAMEDAWNLISVPVGLTNYAKGAVFPTSISNAFTYGLSGYQIEDTLNSGWGYWLKFSGAQNVSLTGLSIVRDTVSVRSGWNIIGSLSEPVPVSAVLPLGTSLLSPFFSFGSFGYTDADTLYPGVGHWVKVSNAGQVILRPSSVLSPAMIPAIAPEAIKSGR